MYTTSLIYGIGVLPVFNRYVAVGNKPFLSSCSGQYQSYVLHALLNLRQSLARANLAGCVKLVVPFNADACKYGPLQRRRAGCRPVILNHGTALLKSSAEPRLEDAFFNQVVALNHAGLFSEANAKKNAIYAVHIDYGANPASTGMDYIAEFTATMPILSLTGTSDGSTDGEHIVQTPVLLVMPANSDGSAILESSHGSLSADLLMAMATLVPPILSSSSERVPVASRSESFPS
ncbi:hypothetical protein Patl1_09644 [Pistacia atlantica]|uniref:Uncharacterized protein n=1 Tax=Pistacia atlantica TaxID=434234 RepID=A0ACC1A5I9_9ROSI|nr:hypothetical protein Patl1_09644 [Pistacia atlantica]